MLVIIMLGCEYNSLITALNLLLPTTTTTTLLLLNFDFIVTW